MLGELQDIYITKKVLSLFWENRLFSFKLYNCWWLSILSEFSFKLSLYLFDFFFMFVLKLSLEFFSFFGIFLNLAFPGRSPIFKFLVLGGNNFIILFSMFAPKIFFLIFLDILLQLLGLQFHFVSSEVVFAFLFNKHIFQHLFETAFGSGQSVLHYFSNFLLSYYMEFYLSMPIYKKLMFFNEVTFDVFLQKNNQRYFDSILQYLIFFNKLFPLGFFVCVWMHSPNKSK